MSNEIDKLGIIAGAGQLPLLVAKNAIEQGKHPVIIKVSKDDHPCYSDLKCDVYEFGVGQIGKITKKLLDRSVTHLILIGKVEPSILLSPFKIDKTTIKLLAKHRHNPSSIVTAILCHFQESGFSILKQDHFLPHLLPKPGILTKRKPTSSQWEDIKLGINIARETANKEIGQTVVVKNQIVLAVEAIEGTDLTICRGGELGGKGIIVAKAAAVEHDFRIDIPTVGMDTLKTIHSVNGSVLAVEANRTFIMDSDTFYEQAEKWKISIVAVE
ncbi:UDP-2,3-diacylglucosamine diphosphatase LpxI [Candidatus Poribacteria bacterium]|nr:UDP-2,3-diacylglucosamine diphosphatase LpxI [Candidatus Poribacteria bacterium]